MSIPICLFLTLTAVTHSHWSAIIVDDLIDHHQYAVVDLDLGTKAASSRAQCFFYGQRRSTHASLSSNHLMHGASESRR
jgi:hypothetical protein